MTKEEFVAQLDWASGTMPNLPVTTALVKSLSQQLKKGEPDWWKGTLKSWEKRKFVAWDEAWTLFISCLHFEALHDAQNPLVPFFPSCGGTDEADPDGALREFLRSPPKSFFENLRRGHRRTYVEYRSALWPMAATYFFQRRELPYYVVEVNAGAGLNLAVDLAVPVKMFKPDLVAARIGLDPEPIQLDDIIHRRWATAAFMPDQVSLIASLDRAIELMEKRQAREANFIQLVQCGPEAAPQFVAKNIPSDDADVGLLLFNTATTVRMTDPEYAAYRNEIAAMMKPWGDRALWVEIENVRGEKYSMTFQLRVNRLYDGQMKEAVMGTVAPASLKVDFDNAVCKKLDMAPEMPAGWMGPQRA